MKAESTILVSLATGIASVCLLLTCLNMYMLSNMRSTLKSLDERLADNETPQESYGSSALIEEPAYSEKDDIINALYNHLDQQNNQIAQYEMKLQHLAELHEHRRQLLEEQEAVRRHHLQTQKALESQKRKLAKKLTKFQLEKQAHEHRKQIEEYERQLHQTFDQLYELQRRQEEAARQVQPSDNSIVPEDVPEGMVFMVHQDDEFPFNPLEQFLSHIFGPGIFGLPYEDDSSMDPAVTVSLSAVRDTDNTPPDHPDFGNEPTPVEDADVLADSDVNHVVKNRVLPELDEVPSTTPTPFLPTPAA